MATALAVLGLLGQGIQAAIDAARAATAADEEKAFSILFDVIDQTTALVGPLRAKIEANKAEAEKALAEKFPADEITKP